MAGTATKAAENVFYKARHSAADHNDRLSSRESAAEILGIDRTRLAHIELGTVVPHPDEVLMMMDAYNSPELLNYYCSTLCPLGIGTVAPIASAKLETVTLQLLSVTQQLPEIKNGIVQIAADGRIDNDERPKMEHYLHTLEEIDKAIQAIRMIYRKSCAQADNPSLHNMERR